MKISTITCLFTIIIYCINNVQCFFQNTEVVYAGEKPTLMKMVTRRFHNFWSWIQAQPQDSFIGRCGGMFKKLKMMMTFIVFKLGVILTTLAFLSVFALKTLGLLVLLVVINSAGLLAKLTGLKQQSVEKHPQNIHIYVTKNDDHDYVEHPPYHHSKWIDRGDLEEKYYRNHQELDDIYDRLSMYRNVNRASRNQFTYR